MTSLVPPADEMNRFVSRASQVALRYSAFSCNKGHGQTFTLSYLANSHSISEVESGSFERHINRQTNSHRISSIENEWNQADRANFTYSYDALGRVSSRVMTGSIKDAYGSNTTELRDAYTYNARHELTAAKTESKISGAYQELVGRKHAFTYDHQGNRKTHSCNDHTTTYTTNNLNQYTARTNHGFLLVEGTSTNAAVKVYETGSTEAAATRKNDYFFRDWDPDPASKASDYPEINVKEGTAFTSTGKAWIPGVSETPITYDANGNLTGDAQWIYTYDEENRLIKMAETSAAATAGFTDTAITFKYDYLGRRVEKKVVRGTTTVSNLRFVWRGWLLVAELNAASDNAKVKTYTWGPDVSGSFGGAGGNGGVLIFKDHTSTVNESFYPAYDAQGNVTGLIDTSGNLDAAYEYDPFGKLIRYAGTRRASMSLLYGTKYTDMETGLIYFGHRYYDPRQGRFINRDPIGEEGGYNLYRFVGNSPVNRLDFLGLCESEGDTDEYGNEICHDEYVLRPFTVDGEITSTDLNIWAIQDENTERLIEQLIAEYSNHQSNADTGNASPANNVGPKKKVKPKKEEELPPCSELKAKFNSEDNRPVVTAESFIPGASAGPYHGDNRGFLDSPSTDSIDTTSRISVSSTYYPTMLSQSNTTEFRPISVTHTVGETVIDLGVIELRRTASIDVSTFNASIGDRVYMNVSYTGANPLSLPIITPSIRMNARISINFETGNLSGNIDRSSFPAAQIFFDGKSIYKGDASSIGAIGLYVDDKGEIDGAQVCDPTK